METHHSSEPSPQSTGTANARPRSTDALRAVADACARKGLRAPVRGASIFRTAVAAPRWGLDEVRGRVVELAAGGRTAALTAVIGVIREGQQQGEPTIWISATPSMFCPEDASQSGVDLSSLVVVRVPQVFAAMRSAERVLRSGAFGVVVLDLGANPRVPNGMVGKLVKLAQRHSSAVLALTASRAGAAPAGSLGSLVGLRMDASRERVGDGRFRCVVRVAKDKQRGAGWQSEREYRGPTGLR